MKKRGRGRLPEDRETIKAEVFQYMQKNDHGITKIARGLHRHPATITPFYHRFLEESRIKKEAEHILSLNDSLCSSIMRLKR